MGDIPDFIPKTPGDLSVIDLSHTLTAPASESIQQAIANCNFTSRVLILPSTYNCPDVHQLSLDLAKAWHTEWWQLVRQLFVIFGQQLIV